MNKIYFDTEFEGLRRDAALISIGFVMRKYQTCTNLINVVIFVSL